MTSLSFLRHGVAAVLTTAAILLSACGGAGKDSAVPGATSTERFRWKMVTTWPPNLPVFSDSVEAFAEEVATMSGGRLTIDVFAGGELVPALQVFDAVTRGIAEMGHGSGYYWAGKIPAAQFLSTVPFGMSAAGMHSWIYAGDGLELWREIYEPFGVVPFPMGNTGYQMGGWFNHRIDSVADLSELRMRIPGLGGKVFARAGGNPVLFSGGDLFVVLERGNIDAAEWVGPFHDTRLGLDQAAQYYYYPGWHEPGTQLELIVNAKAWAKLPGDLKSIVETAAAATDVRMLARFDAANAKALEALKAEGEVEILPFPDDVLAELETMTRETLAAQAADDPTLNRVYERFRAFRARDDAWRSITEDALRYRSR